MNFSPSRYHRAVGANESPGHAAQQPGAARHNPAPRPESSGLGISGAFLIATLSTALLAFILGAWVRVLVVLFDAGWMVI